VFQWTERLNGTNVILSVSASDVCWLDVNLDLLNVLSS